MPIHDWTRVEAGTFHGFHTAWVTHLSEALNNGVLPASFYAMPEQHAGAYVADVLTLQVPTAPSEAPLRGALAVAEAAPRMRRKLTASGGITRSRRRTLAIRHVTGHRLVAIVEIVSPSNKDRARHVREFIAKIENALRSGVHVLLVDLFPPGPHDPEGLAGMVWKRLDPDPYEPPAEEPLTLASFVAQKQPDVYLEYAAAGSSLPDMPLFLHTDRYVLAPLERTYGEAYRGLPAYWREVLERASP